MSQDHRIRVSYHLRVDPKKWPTQKRRSPLSDPLPCGQSVMGCIEIKDELIIDEIEHEPTKLKL